jgi:hypothetical protein
VDGSALLFEQRVIVNFPANQLINVTELSTPAQRLVPAPNVDTLYTVARVDLRNGPLVIHVPDEQGRYYTLQFLDAYTNTFAYIGRRVTGTRAGNYAVVGPGWRGPLPSGVRRITSPTPTTWLLGRTLVNGPSDLEQVHAIQRGYTLTPLRAGLLRGLRIGRAQVDAYARRLRTASERHHNGWLLPPADTGNFGTDYLLRAYVARDALGANVPREAVYPFAFVDRRGRTLTGAHRYVLHFAAHQLPPVGAFWSLTMYDKDVFLAPNAINRYAIGDRTPGLRRNTDGSLDILLQHARPGTRASNWLPAPRGRFILALRLYQPRPSVLHGTWRLPTISPLRLSHGSLAGGS